MIAVLFAISVIVFLIFNVIPNSDPAARIAGKNANPELIARVSADLGLDQPLPIQYLTLMRQHHLGGIHMAQEVLSRTKNPDVTFLAQSMVQNQQGEITVISGYLQQLGAA